MLPSTILVVEDSSVVRRLLVRVLQLRGYDVLEASCGPAAIALAEAHAGPIHVLLTDLVMPGMPGTALAKELVCLYPEIRILIMTGYVGRIADLPDNWGTIDKPFTPDGLVKKLEELDDFFGTPPVGSLAAVANVP